MLDVESFGFVDTFVVVVVVVVVKGVAVVVAAVAVKEEVIPLSTISSVCSFRIDDSFVLPLSVGADEIDVSRFEVRPFVLNPSAVVIVAVVDDDAASDGPSLFGRDGAGFDVVDWILKSGASKGTEIVVLSVPSTGA